jgi:hypothetical protein
MFVLRLILHDVASDGSERASLWSTRKATNKLTDSLVGFEL